MIRSMHFLAIEKITFLYILLTSLIIFYLFPQLPNANQLLINRLLIISTISTLTYINSIKNWSIIRFLRFAFIGSMLSYWYPETFEINRILPNFDFLLARWEQMIFGCQPAIEFCQLYPQQWLNELMNMGYFSYYPMIICSSFYFYFFNRKYFKFFTFAVVFTFFCYYLIFIIFPTAGPQYYFKAIGMENVSTATFPNIRMYFNTNEALLSSDGHIGFFNQLVEKTQQLGEKPTAAFPSSHVGLSTLVMILVLSNRRYILLGILSPFYILLVAATIYIQAHYAIDVIAGLASAVLFYYFSILSYQQITRKFYGVVEFRAAYLKEPIISKQQDKELISKEI